MLDTGCWMILLNLSFFIENPETDIQYLLLLKNKLNRRNERQNIVDRTSLST